MDARKRLDSGEAYLDHHSHRHFITLLRHYVTFFFKKVNGNVPDLTGRPSCYSKYCFGNNVNQPVP